MIAQVALSVPLVIGAGLLVHSLVNLQAFDVGFDAKHVVRLKLSDSDTRRTPEQSEALTRTMLDRARQVPGIKSVSLSGIAPLSGDEIGINVVAVGEAPTDSTHAFFSGVTPGYFATLGIPILSGREFAESDRVGTAPVAVINQTMARRYFGERNPIGRLLRFVEGHRSPVEIIGVVKDATYVSIRESAPNFFYLARCSRLRRWCVESCWQEPPAT